MNEPEINFTNFVDRCPDKKTLSGQICAGCWHFIDLNGFTQTLWSDQQLGSVCGWGRSAGASSQGTDRVVPTRRHPSLTHHLPEQSPADDVLSCLSPLHNVQNNSNHLVFCTCKREGGGAGSAYLNPQSVLMLSVGNCKTEELLVCVPTFPYLDFHLSVCL